MVLLLDAPASRQRAKSPEYPRIAGISRVARFLGNSAPRDKAETKSTAGPCRRAQSRTDTPGARFGPLRLRTASAVRRPRGFDGATDRGETLVDRLFRAGVGEPNVPGCSEWRARDGRRVGAVEQPIGDVLVAF